MDNQKPYLLCIDDEVNNLDALERIFRKQYTVLKAAGAAEAFLLLKIHSNIPVIISDQRMPEVTGVEFLEKSIETHPDAIRILLTGYTDIESVIEAVNKGQIYRYLTKPWDTTDLLSTVNQALEKFNLRHELRRKNQELQSALDELKTLDQAKSQFMILINHELKTPLTAIMSFAGLLKETILNEEQTLFSNRILKSSEKLKSIIDDVMLIVKGEVGLIPVKPETVNLPLMFKDLNSEIATSLQTKQQRIDYQFEFESLNTDPQLFKIAFMRALQNATKFGKVNESILVKSVKHDEGHVVSIINKGPHISDSIINKILKPFQLDENVMNHSVGMGLGLTICQTLMKALKGQLKIHNTSDGVQVDFIF